MNNTAVSFERSNKTEIFISGMNHFISIYITAMLLAGVSTQATAQKSTDTVLTAGYLAGTWVVHHVDTVFDHQQVLKLRLYGNNRFEQWMLTDGKINDKHTGTYKIMNNTIIFVAKKGRENIYQVVQLSIMYLKLKERTASDIITFVRE